MSVRQIPEADTGDENPFAMSTGDLMSALMFIFVLVMMALMLKITEAENSKKQIVRDYQETRDSIYTALKIGLADSLISWNAVLDSSLTIRFSDEVAFSPGSSNLSPKFESVMQRFFQRYLSILLPFEKSIAEIRIEGHTDSTVILGCRYGNFLCNMNLSQERSRNVLLYGLTKTGIATNDSLLEFAQKFVSATGYSFSHGKATSAESRRVEFSVKTNAEDKIQEILKAINKEKSDVTPGAF